MLQIGSSAPQTVANKVAKYCAQKPKLPKDTVIIHIRLSWRLHTFSTALTQGCRERTHEHHDVKKKIWKTGESDLKSGVLPKSSSTSPARSIVQSVITGGKQQRPNLPERNFAFWEI